MGLLVDVDVDVQVEGVCGSTMTMGGEEHHHHHCQR